MFSDAEVERIARALWNHEEWMAPTNFYYDWDEGLLRRDYLLSELRKILEG